MQVNKQWMFFLSFIAWVFIAPSCGQQKNKVLLPEDSEIREIWDNGVPRTVWVFATVDGAKSAIKEIQYHANGTKSMEGPLKNNLRDGSWKSWYPDGKLWSTGSFKDGLRHGRGIVYHPNGNTFIEGTYMMGQRVGKWAWFDESGNSISEDEGIRMAPYYVDSEEEYFEEDSMQGEVFD